MALGEGGGVVSEFGEASHAANSLAPLLQHLAGTRPLQQPGAPTPPELQVFFFRSLLLKSLNSFGSILISANHFRNVTFPTLSTSHSQFGGLRHELIDNY